MLPRKKFLVRVCVCVKQKERKINKRLEEVKVCRGMFKDIRGEDVRADIL